MLKKSFFAVSFLMTTTVFANDSHYSVMSVRPSIKTADKQLAIDLFADCRILFRHVVDNQALQGEMITDQRSDARSNRTIRFQATSKNGFRDTFYRAKSGNKSLMLIEPEAGALELFDTGSGASVAEQNRVTLDRTRDDHGARETVRAPR